jgi:carbonic anhydrase
LPKTTSLESIYEPPADAEAAYQELLEGNKRFVSAHLTHFEQDLKILQQHTAINQQPFAAVLSCADSRVPVELILDQSIGHIFVTRIAGNVITPEVIASLEYAAAILHVKVILVIGHSGCGAVNATIQFASVPGQISALFSRIQPAVDEAGPDWDGVVRANARIQASLLRKSSTVISSLVEQGKLKVVATHYDLVSGVVTPLE